jgi:hypothetical protein
MKLVGINYALCILKRSSRSIGWYSHPNASKTVAQSLICANRHLFSCNVTEQVVCELFNAKMPLKSDVQRKGRGHGCVPVSVNLVDLSATAFKWHLNPKPAIFVMCLMYCWPNVALVENVMQYQANYMQLNLSTYRMHWIQRDICWILQSSSDLFGWNRKSAVPTQWHSTLCISKYGYHCYEMPNLS